MKKAILKRWACLCLTLVTLLAGGLTLTSQAASNQQNHSTNYTKPKYQITGSWNQDHPNYNQILTGTRNVYDLPDLLAGSYPVTSQAKLKQAVRQKQRFVAYQGATVNYRYNYYRIKSKTSQIKGWVGANGIQTAKPSTKATNRIGQHNRITNRWKTGDQTFDKTISEISPVYRQPGVTSRHQIVNSKSQVRNAVKRGQKFATLQGITINYRHHYYQIISRDHRIRGWIPADNVSKDSKPEDQELAKQIKENVTRAIVIMTAAKAERRHRNPEVTRSFMRIARQYLQRAKKEINRTTNRSHWQAQIKVINKYIHFPRIKNNASVNSRLVNKIDNDIKATKAYNTLINSHSSRVSAINRILSQIIRENEHE